MRFHMLQLFKRLPIAALLQSLYIQAKHGVPKAIDSNRSSSIAVDAACRAEGVINCAIVESVAGELRLTPG